MGESGRAGPRPGVMGRLATVGVFAALFLGFSFFAHNFFTVNGVLNLLVQTSTFTIMAIGSTLVLIVGGIDLSLGAMVALGGTTVSALTIYGVPIWLSMIAALAVCGLFGCANGLIVTRLTLPPFLATMSIAMIIYGLLALLGFCAFYHLFPFNHPPPPNPPDIGVLANTPVFRIYSRSAAGGRTVVFPGISWVVIIMVFTAVLLQFVSTKTRIGRSFRIVGSNREAARFSGIKVTRVAVLAYILSGILASLSGILLASRLGAAPGGAVGYEMIAITCAMIGGASLSGGVGSIWGTVIGSFIISTLSTGLAMMNTSNPAVSHLFNGAVVLAAVCLDRLRDRRQALRRPVSAKP